MATPAGIEKVLQIAVRCHGVTKTYGQDNAAVQALRGVDLEVRTGELLMLVGPSGCGKTMLISGPGRGAPSRRWNLFGARPRLQRNEAAGNYPFPGQECWLRFPGV
jgi:hypothetical protein